MKRLLAYLFASIALAIALSLCTGVSVPEKMLSTFYTVAGIIFSVGMSLIVLPKTDGVANAKIRKAIRLSYMRVRDLFMYWFGLDTILFILAEGNFWSKLHAFFNIWCGIFMIFSLAYYIYNFMSLQKLGEQIEDQILKERESKQGSLY